MFSMTTTKKGYNCISCLNEVLIGEQSIILFQLQRQIETEIYRQLVRQIDRQIDKQIDRQIIGQQSIILFYLQHNIFVIQIDTEIDTEIDRQIKTEIYRQIQRYIDKQIGILFMHLQLLIYLHLSGLLIQLSFPFPNKIDGLLKDRWKETKELVVHNNIKV